MKIKYLIPENLKNIRLDKFLCQYNTCLTRKQAVLIINQKFMLVNKQIKKPGYRLQPGDMVIGYIIESTDNTDNKNPVAENISTDIIFEDTHILVINKSAGMVVHPANGNLSGTLVNALLYSNPEITGLGEEKNRTGIVHRLDKDTSGLIVVAKDRQALNFLKKEFRERRVKKKYLALITGNPDQDQGIIDLPVGRHPVKKTIMAVNYDTGKTAVTKWKIKKRFKDACLVEIDLKTGRTHQIRVHFYSTGHPLIGERVYTPARIRKQQKQNKTKQNKNAPRQMLHSSSLSFIHPYSGHRMYFTSELAQDFVEVMSILTA